MRRGAAAPRGVFVTGTDTGVGKTVVACALIRGLRARGIEVGALKPVETGVGSEGPADARALLAACGSPDLSLDDVCPQRFALAAAPTVAARAEGRRVELDAMEAAFGRVMARHDCIIVEGAGGLLAPAAEDLSMAELALRLALPLLLVARARLGTLNHTRLTLEAARARGLPVLGLVVCHADGELTPAEAANLEALREDPGVAWLGEIPPLPPGTLPASDALDLEVVLTAVRSLS